MSTRRRFLQACCALPALTLLTGFSRSAADFTPLKTGYAQRLKRLLAAGDLPYIDIESSCNSGKLDIDDLARRMDRLNIGLMALSADIGPGQFKRGVRFDDLSDRLLAAYPDRFVPVGNGGQPPALTEAPDAFLEAQEAAIQAGRMALLGEYEFRHYPSPRQAKRGDLQRDVHIPIDGPVGRRVFELSQRTGTPFQIHYEIEDALLAPLEAMLTAYPGAKVIWCHVAQIRYLERGGRYTPAYVEGLIRRFPQLYFDTAFGDASAIYPLSNQRHARVWADDSSLRSDWLELIVAHPERFLSALDLGGDRMDRIGEYDQTHRNFLNRLPAATRHQVAYRSAWALLFGEEFN